jgi:Domain of unknown function (DUF4271)
MKKRGMRLFFVSVIIFFFSTSYSFGQLTNKDSITSLLLKTDIIDSSSQKDSILANTKTYDAFLRKLLSNNKYINYGNNALPAVNKRKSSKGKEWIFYLLSVDMVLLGLFKVFYTKYFNNIFRVFFNTSLRQNQLTDILLQARLPSLIFNLFFIVNAGLYIWLILSNYSLRIAIYKSIFPATCIALLGLIYIVKFFILKIIGWITGMEDPADTYIFVIFLINKIICIILIPFIVLLAFAPQHWEKGISLLSFTVIVLLFLLRYFRSFGLLKHEFTLNRFHFFIYVLAFEIIPVLILYKIVMRITVLA